MYHVSELTVCMRCSIFAGFVETVLVHVLCRDNIYRRDSLHALPRLSPTDNADLLGQYRLPQSLCTGVPACNVSEYTSPQPSLQHRPLFVGDVSVETPRRISISLLLGTQVSDITKTVSVKLVLAEASDGAQEPERRAHSVHSRPKNIGHCSWHIIIRYN